MVSLSPGFGRLRFCWWEVLTSVVVCLRPFVLVLYYNVLREMASMGVLEGATNTSRTLGLSITLIYTHMYIYIYIHVYIYTHVYTYTHIHTHIHIYIYTHIHTHIHNIYTYSKRRCVNGCDRGKILWSRVNLGVGIEYIAYNIYIHSYIHPCMVSLGPGVGRLRFCWWEILTSVAVCLGPLVLVLL